MLGSLFDGIGGFPYAASFFGIKTLWASEILPCAISVTKRHLPDMTHVGDITKLHGGTLPPVDIITFGSPCQGLSAAGKRKGLADPRSGLFLEAIRIIKEMREATNGKYPRFAVWENVPGALHSNKGLDFKAVLEAFAAEEVPIPTTGKWTNAGMVRGGGADIAWVLYNAQHFGTAQRRRRIFLVADFGGECAGEILFIPKSLRGYFAAGGTPWQGTPCDAPGCADGGTLILNDQGGDSLNVEKDGKSPTLRSQTHGNLPVVAKPVNCLNPWDTQQSRVFAEDGKAPTLAGADGGGGRNPGGLVLETYPINTQLATRHNALGENTGFGVGEDGGPAFTLLGAHCHAVAVGVHQNQTGSITTSPNAYSLTTAGTASARNAPLVAHPKAHAFSLDGAESNSMKSPNPNSGCREVDTARTIDTTNPCPSKNQGGIAIVEAHPQVSGTLCASGAGLSRPGGMASETDLCVAYCLQGNMIGREDKNGPMGNGVNENISFTLTATDTPAVATVFNRQRSDSFGEDNLASTQTARQCKDSTDLIVAAVDCRNFKEVGDLSGTLQAKNAPGYSLNYQNPVRTGYVVRRLTPTECERLQGFPDGWTAFDCDGKPISDTKRYQMLGNAVAVPCVAYILLGIAKVFGYTEEVT